MTLNSRHPYSFFKGLLICIIFCAAVTPWSAWVDLKISNLFYHEGHFASHPLWDGIYLYGVWPAWLIIGLACIGFSISFFKPYRSWRIPSLFLILTLAVGSGLIIHAGLKDHWGRPRPRQVVEFGGSQTFRPYYHPNLGHQSEPAKSFACGHCSMGFYFFALAALGVFYRHRTLYRLGMALGWGLGILLSMARIAQGGHFFSDTVASAVIMWFTTWGLACFLLKREDRMDERINTEATENFTIHSTFH